MYRAPARSSRVVQASEPQICTVLRPLPSAAPGRPRVTIVATRTAIPFIAVLHRDWPRRSGDRVRAVLDPKVFKAYDIRGIYPTELDEDGAYATGRAYVEQFEPKRIAVGHDMRVSSPTMARSLIRGATDAGADVLDLGLIGTEMLYFGVGELDLDGGITITASHNPKEYNGMKIVRRGELPGGSDSGLFDIRDRALSIAAMAAP